jgi:hypothetical protein
MSQRAERQYRDDVAREISRLQRTVELGAREMLLVIGEKVLDSQCCESLLRFVISLRPIVHELTELRALIAPRRSKAFGLKKMS